MMRKFKWINIFLIIWSTTILVCVLTLLAIRPVVNYNDLITSKVYKLPFYLYIFIVLLIISSIISTILYYGLKTQHKEILKKLQLLIDGNYNNELFEENNKKIVLLNYTNLFNEQILALRNRLMNVSNEMKQLSNVSAPASIQVRQDIIEEERQRIARELHDSVSQQLFAAMMLLSAMNYTVPKDNVVLKKQMETIERIVNEAQIEMRALLLHLRPVKLEGKSLSEGIRYLLKELDSKVTMQITFSIQNIKLSDAVEDHLFRIVQELLSNVLRHSKATTLEVYLQQTDKVLQLRVVDNGIGFDVEQSQFGSYGLLNIRDRINSMGGNLKVVSVKQQGTAIDISIPS